MQFIELNTAMDLCSAVGKQQRIGRYIALHGYFELVQERRRMIRESLFGEMLGFCFSNLGVAAAAQLWARVATH